MENNKKAINSLHVDFQKAIEKCDEYFDNNQQMIR